MPRSIVAKYRAVALLGPGISVGSYNHFHSNLYLYLYLYQSFGARYMSSRIETKD
jgi:hypothetical protein